MTGVVAGFKKQRGSQKRDLMARAMGNPENSTHYLSALVAVEDKRLQHHFHMRHPRIKMTSMSHSSSSRSAYESGKEQGRHLNVSKAITSHGGNTGRLITF